MEEKRLPWSARLAFGSGHILNDLVSNMIHAYLLLFLKKVLSVNSYYSGIIVSSSEFVDAGATFVFGYLSDREYDFWICNK